MNGNYSYLVPLARRAPNPRPMLEVPRLGILDELFPDV
jgi:hypothetical protein